MMATTDSEWHLLPAEDGLRRLRSASTGLSSTEAALRLDKHGPNALPAPPRESAAKVLTRQLKSVVMLLLFVAAAVAVATGDRLEAGAILAVLVINIALGFILEMRARKSLDSLLALEAPLATALRDGKPLRIAARNLVPGDVIIVEAGDRVPADARVLTATELRTSEAELTGESLPVLKTDQELVGTGISIADRTNMLYLSTHVVTGAGRALVVGAGASTEVGRLGGLLGGIKEERTPLEHRLDDLGKRLVGIALGAGILVGVIGFMQGLSGVEVWKTALALAIAAVPEGLPAVATVALALGVRRLARRQALVRRLPAVETLGSVTVVCTDKTGTLTAGEMTVTRLFVAGRQYTVSGAGYSPAGAIHREDSAADVHGDDALRIALTIGSVANRASLLYQGEVWTSQGDPTEAALLTAAMKAGLSPDAVLESYPEVAEVPFSSELKLMATFHHTSSGSITAYVKGAPQVLLGRSTTQLTGTGSIPLTGEGRDALLRRNDEMAANGLRVLAVAFRDDVPATDITGLESLCFVGLIGIVDPPAEGVLETVQLLKSAGIRTLMITGDQQRTAEAVARELGLVGDEVAVLDTGDMARLTDEELAIEVSRISVFSRATPADKLRIINSLRNAGEIVAMLGDGVNDAPALRRADIGVAMGKRGTDLAKAAAGMVLQDDRFRTIGAAVEEGRVVYGNIRKFVFYLFSCNLAEILVLVIAGALGWPLPLLPLQILWMNLVTDTFPALALAAEPAERNAMRQPPRDPAATVLSREFLWSIFGYASLLTLVTLAAYMAAGGPVGSSGAIGTAFLTLSLAQVLHLGNARSSGPVSSYRAIVSNPMALAAVVFTIGLQLVAVYLPPLAEILELRPPDTGEWLLILPLAALPAIVGQVTKFVRGAARQSPQMV